MDQSIIDEYFMEIERINSLLNSKKCTDDERIRLEKRKDRSLESLSSYVVAINKTNKATKSELILDWAKVIIPVLVPIIAYDVFQKRVLKFEEDGSICSSAGRQLHLPRFFK